ncbi:MAG TPA: hypothetical protein VI300_11965 [Solirubrobacter sp.]
MTDLRFVVSLEAGDRAMATITPVALRVSDLLVISSPATAAAFSAQALAIGWRETPLPD